jgi:hypothetical protein
MMTGLIIKLIGTPLLVYIASIIIPGVRYANITQAILVGVLIAFVGHLLELLLLTYETLAVSTLIDFFTAFLIVYFSRSFFPTATITFTGALITALLIAVGEYVQHQYLTRTHKTQKSE